MAVFILLCLIVAGMCAATADAVRVECDRTITVPMGFGLMSCTVSALAVAASIDVATLPLIVATRAIAH